MGRVFCHPRAWLCRCEDGLDLSDGCLWTLQSPILQACNRDRDVRKVLVSPPPPTKAPAVTERAMPLLRSARKPCGTVCVVFAANPKQHQGFCTCVGKGASRHERRKAWDETASLIFHDRFRSSFQKNVKN